LTNEETPSSDSGIYELAPEEKAEPVKRWVAPEPTIPMDNGAVCPGCKYKLEGLKSDRCPECGMLLTRAAIRETKQKREWGSDSSWFDSKGVLFALIGLVVGSLVWGLTEGNIHGVYDFLIYFGITAGIGWVVFIFCSMFWIGFDQPLQKTLVQTIGAYGMYSAVSALLMLVPLPGIILFFVGMFVLVSLLSEMLDIDLQDAIVLALVASIVKVLVLSYVLILEMS